MEETRTVGRRGRAAVAVAGGGGGGRKRGVVRWSSAVREIERQVLSETSDSEQMRRLAEDWTLVQDEGTESGQGGGTKRGAELEGGR